MCDVVNILYKWKNDAIKDTCEALINMCLLAIDDRSKVVFGVQTLLEKAGADIHALGLINIHEEPDIEKQSDDDDIDRCPLEFTRVANRRDDV